MNWFATLTIPEVQIRVFPRDPGHLLKALSGADIVIAPGNMAQHGKVFLQALDVSSAMKCVCHLISSSAYLFRTRPSPKFTFPFG